MRATTGTFTFTLTVTTLAFAALFATPALADPPEAAPAAPPPAAGAPAPVSAAPPTVTAPLAAAPAPRGISAWGILPWGGLGAGMRFMTKLGNGGVLVNSTIRDSFALEIGADILRWSYSVNAFVDSYDYSWTEILPVVGVMWNLWLNDRFALYPKIELGYAFGWFSGDQGVLGRAAYGGLFANGAGGILYRINDALTLRAEGGYAGLKLGVGWLF